MLIINENHPDVINMAIKFLRERKAIIFATDTIYGIAVDAANDKAVECLYKLKKRDKKKPVAIFVKDLNMAKNIFSFEEKSLKIAQKFLPGPLTMVLKLLENPGVKPSKNLNEGDGFLGFRIVNKKFINDLLAEFNGILAVSSANISGEKNAISIAEIKQNFLNEDVLLIEGEEINNTVGSTVARFCDGEIEIIREGVIKKEYINEDF